MSKYEQVCDMIRQRRSLRESARLDRRAGVMVNGARMFDETEIVAVIQDALLELPAHLFGADAVECASLALMARTHPQQRARCLLLHRDELDWPLQSEMDA